MAIGFAGTSISDIEQGAEDALEEDISNLSPADNSVAGQLDGGVSGGVDWASKTPKVISNTGSNTSVVSASGSGYIISIRLMTDSNSTKWQISIDGNNLDSDDRLWLGTADNSNFSSSGHYMLQVGGLIHRFESSFAVKETNFQDMAATVAYVLD